MKIAKRSQSTQKTNNFRESRKSVLIVGKRRKCYQAAIMLGYNVYLWSDGPLALMRKKGLSGYIEEPFVNCDAEFSSSIKNALLAMNLDFVIAATESSVLLAARVRQLVGLPGTEIDLAERLSDKFKMKTFAKSMDVPIAPFCKIKEGDSASALTSLLGLPLVIKPRRESGARGVVVCTNADDVARALKVDHLAEGFMNGCEASVETFYFGGRALFHNVTEYLHQWRKSVAPAGFSLELRERLLALNDRIALGFGVVGGMTHAEFYIGDDGQITFGEMALRPPGGYYMELIEQSYKFDPWQVYLQIETGIQPSLITKTASGYSAIFMIHPSAGRVVKISGISEIHALSQVVQFELRIAIGQIVYPRQSTSSECGHIILHGPTYQGIIADIAKIESLLVIEMASS